MRIPFEFIPDREYRKYYCRSDFQCSVCKFNLPEYLEIDDIRKRMIDKYGNDFQLAIIG